MPDLTDYEAHTVMLHALINDMKHVLEWVTIGLTCLALVQVIAAISNAVERDWIGLGFDCLFAATFAAFAYGNAKRATKYGRAVRRAT